VRYTAFFIILAVIFTGCSQESDEKTTATGIKVEQEVKKSADKNEALICIDADNKITCKLMTKRVNKDRAVEFEWESPSGKDDRKREMVLPANHASVFDSRLKTGREKGVWHVEVEINDEKVSTTFKI